MSASFNQYQRQEVQGRLKYLVITLYIFSALVVGMYIVRRIMGVNDVNLQFFAFQLVPITLSMTVGFCLAKRDTKFAEIQGLLLIGT